MIVLKVAGTGVLVIIFLMLISTCIDRRRGKDIVESLAGLAMLLTLVCTAVSLWFL